MWFLLYVMPWILFVLLIVSWMPWRDIFEKIWGNNPNRAKVYVEYGEQTILCKGRKVQGTERTARYRFKCLGVWRTVLVPKSYPMKYLLGSRMIRVVGDASSPSDLGGVTKTSIAVSGDMLDDVFRANIGANLIRTIFGKAIGVMTILIVIGILVFAGYFMYNNILKKQSGQPQPQQGIEQPVQPQQPQEPVIIPKPIG